MLLQHRGLRPGLRLTGAVAKALRGRLHRLHVRRTVLQGGAALPCWAPALLHMLRHSVAHWRTAEPDSATPAPPPAPLTRICISRGKPSGVDNTGKGFCSTPRCVTAPKWVGLMSAGLLGNGSRSRACHDVCGPLLVEAVAKKYWSLLPEGTDARTSVLAVTSTHKYVHRHIDDHIEG